MAELRRSPVRGRVHDARALPNVYGRTSGKPRSALANPQHRDCAEGATDRGRLLFGYFLLARQEKVTRSSAGGVEALALQHETRQSGRKYWITRGSCRVPCGPFAARMFASASCLRSPAIPAGMTGKKCGPYVNTASTNRTST